MDDYKQLISEKMRLEQRLLEIQIEIQQELAVLEKSKPYFTVDSEGWNGEWKFGEVKIPEGK